MLQYFVHKYYKMILKVYLFKQDIDVIPLLSLPSPFLHSLSPWKPADIVGKAFLRLYCVVFHLSARCKLVHNKLMTLSFFWVSRFIYWATNPHTPQLHWSWYGWLPCHSVVFIDSCYCLANLSDAHLWLLI